MIQNKKPGNMQAISLKLFSALLKFFSFCSTFRLRHFKPNKETVFCLFDFAGVAVVVVVVVVVVDDVVVVVVIVK